MRKLDDSRIAVVGLGYVGLPLAIALARHFAVTGFDIDATRIAELRAGTDRTREIDTGVLAASTLAIADRKAALAGHDVYIVTVPTPVDADNRPDLSAVLAASKTVGGALAPGALVIYESTVYPGVTEGVCGPILERRSGLVAGTDFDLGFSPERINPGDRAHTIDRITKVVAAGRPEVTERLAALYGRINGDDIFRARDIRTAEAAKVIENAQRDINIAFVNEVAMIVDRLGLSIYDVLEAAETKWNFLGFRPGLVGGHCIGVDPYYLAHIATELGHDPEIVLAGRRINDAMGTHIAEQIAELAGPPNGARILVLGLTFKENVPDLRNSRVVDIVRALAARGFAVDVHDPLADPAAAAREFNIELIGDLAAAGPYAAVVGAVAHDAYRALPAAALAGLVGDGGIVADIKGMWRGVDLPAGLRRWQL